MAREPFLEIKVDTDAFYFIQELCRLSEAFRERSPLQIDKVWVQVQGLQLHIGRFFDQELDISDFTRTDLEMLTRSDHSVWLLLFNTFQHEIYVKELFEVELRKIGGRYPLLIRFLICSENLEAFLGDVLERCGSWRDAQVVSLSSRSDFWYRFFRNQDIRSSHFLSNRERRYYGDAYARWAPSVLRTACEFAERNHFGDAENTVKEKVAENTSAEPSIVAGLEKPLFAQEAAPNEPLPTAQQDTPSRIYSPTQVKIDKIRELLAQKRRGNHRGKPWSWAVSKAPWTQENGPLDLKTAQKHLAAERAEWDRLNEQERGRTKPGSKPKE